MIISKVLTPSPGAREYVRQFLRLQVSDAAGRPSVRPIIARPDIVLAFALHQQPHEAFEFATAAPRVLPAVVLVGAQTSRRADLLLVNGWSSFAIHFQPAAFSRLFRVPASALTDRALDATPLLGADLEGVRQRLAACRSSSAMVRVAERFLARRAATAGPVPATARAAEALLTSHGRLRVADAIRTTGLSERHFERRFLEHMGMPPKLYARVARLNFVLQLKTERPALTWAQISQEAGYFDQTHLVKDFKAMAGAPPAAFLRAGFPSDGGFLLSSAPAARLS